MVDLVTDNTVECWTSLKKKHKKGWNTCVLVTPKCMKEFPECALIPKNDCVFHTYSNEPIIKPEYTQEMG